MAKIKIMTDSACDIPKEKEHELNIRILNFPITIEEKGYREREDFETQEFYEVLESCTKIPTHAQITPIEFEEAYQKYYDEGYTDLIYISINSNGSATYQNSIMAKNTFFEEHPEAKDSFQIHIVDSTTYSMVYGYAVIEAAEKAKKGAPVNEIIAFVEDWVHSDHVYFATYDLKFAKKSGRVSAVAAFVGELMGLKPILTFDHGKSKVLGKVRGEKAVIPDLIKRAKAEITPNTPYYILSGDKLEKTEELVKECKKALGGEPQGVYPIGAVISINAGPQVVAVVVKGSQNSN